MGSVAIRLLTRARPGTVIPPVAPEIVVFPPEVDISNAACFGVELLVALRPGVGAMIADMTLTAFCDCSGIRELLIANDQARRNLAQLRVVVTTDAVQRVLHVTGFDQVLDIRSSMAAALTGSGHEDYLADSFQRSLQ
jgi:anti-anti-sigma factor